MTGQPFKDGVTLKGFGHPKFGANASKLVSGFKTKTLGWKVNHLGMV
jgi:hypothetical protein